MTNLIETVINDQKQLLESKVDQGDEFQEMITRTPQGQLGNTESHYTARNTQQITQTLDLKHTNLVRLGAKETIVEKKEKLSKWIPFIQRAIKEFHISIPYNNHNITLLMNMYTQKVQEQVSELSKIPILPEEIWLKIFSYISRADKQKMLGI